MSAPTCSESMSVDDFLIYAGKLKQISVESRLQNYAPVAQLDRVLGYEPSGREFESLQARHP